MSGGETIKISSWKGKLSFSWCLILINICDREPQKQFASGISYTMNPSPLGALDPRRLFASRSVALTGAFELFRLSKHRARQTVVPGASSKYQTLLELLRGLRDNASRGALEIPITIESCYRVLSFLLPRQTGRCFFRRIGKLVLYRWCYQ